MKGQAKKPERSGTVPNSNSFQMRASRSGNRDRPTCRIFSVFILNKEVIAIPEKNNYNFSMSKGGQGAAAANILLLKKSEESRKQEAVIREAIRVGVMLA